MSTVCWILGFLARSGKELFLVTQVTSPGKAWSRDVVRTTSPRAPILISSILSNFFQELVGMMVLDPAMELGHFLDGPGGVAVRHGVSGDVLAHHAARAHQGVRAHGDVRQEGDV